MRRPAFGGARTLLAGAIVSALVAVAVLVWFNVLPRGSVRSELAPVDPRTLPWAYLVDPSVAEAWLVVQRKHSWSNEQMRELLANLEARQRREPRTVARAVALLTLQNIKTSDQLRAFVAVVEDRHKNGWRLPDDPQGRHTTGANDSDVLRFYRDVLRNDLLEASILGLIANQ